MGTDDWDRHWSDYADSASRNPAQAMRRRAILSHLAIGAGPARVLDIGCGQGDLLADVGGHHPQADLCGIDYSLQGVEVARDKVPRARFARCDLLQSSGPPVGLAAWATHAICSEVLEHVDDPAAFLGNATAYLAPACRLVVTVPGGPVSAFDRHIGHRRHFTVQDVRGLLHDSGFVVEKVTGAGFPQFNLYRLVVILRGERLAGDVAAGDRGAASLPARLAMALFGGLLALPMPDSPWGWQIVGVARLPAC